MSFRIVFLGTGGGRHAAMYQIRSTGGMLVEHDGSHLHIDPGPGALTQMQRIRYDLANTDSVVISHCHPDHYSDAECVIEGMTYGGWKRRGHIYGTVTVIEGQGRLGPCLSNYHKGIASGCTVIKAGDSLDIDGLRTDIKEAIHNDPANVGFVFHTGHGDVAYVSDTEYRDWIADQYKGVRVLILPATAPTGDHVRGHLNTDDAIEFAKRVRPELVIYVHLGAIMIRAGPDKEAARAERESGVRTIAARDLMTLDVGEELSIGDAEAFPPGWIPPSCP